MTATRTVPEGGLRFVPGVYRYSAGVAAEPGFAGSVLAYVLSGAVRPETPATGPSGSSCTYWSSSMPDRRRRRPRFSRRPPAAR